MVIGSICGAGRARSRVFRPPLGPPFDVFLHEFGHALFDLLDVPLFGREEDAADQVLAYIMLHFGKPEARRLTLGTAYAYKPEVEASIEPVAMTAFADEHDPPGARRRHVEIIARESKITSRYSPFR